MKICVRLFMVLSILSVVPALAMKVRPSGKQVKQIWNKSDNPIVVNAFEGKNYRAEKYKEKLRTKKLSAKENTTIPYSDERMKNVGQRQFDLYTKRLEGTSNAHKTMPRESVLLKQAEYKALRDQRENNLLNQYVLDPTGEGMTVRDIQIEEEAEPSEHTPEVMYDIYGDPIPMPKYEVSKPTSKFSSTKKKSSFGQTRQYSTSSRPSLPEGKIKERAVNAVSSRVKKGIARIDFKDINNISQNILNLIDKVAYSLRNETYPEGMLNQVIQQAKSDLDFFLEWNQKSQEEITQKLRSYIREAKGSRARAMLRLKNELKELVNLTEFTGENLGATLANVQTVYDTAVANALAEIKRVDARPMEQIKESGQREHERVLKSALNMPSAERGDIQFAQERLKQQKEEALPGVTDITTGEMQSGKDELNRAKEIEESEPSEWKPEHGVLGQTSSGDPLYLEPDSDNEGTASWHPGKSGSKKPGMFTGGVNWLRGKTNKKTGSHQYSTQRKDTKSNKSTTLEKTKKQESKGKKGSLKEVENVLTKLGFSISDPKKLVEIKLSPYVAAAEGNINVGAQKLKGLFWNMFIQAQKDEITTVHPIALSYIIDPIIDRQAEILKKREVVHDTARGEFVPQSEFIKEPESIDLNKGMDEPVDIYGEKIGPNSEENTDSVKKASWLSLQGWRDWLKKRK